ncbi:MAG TPA: enoyl-CoA hydratase-related protein [Solirubrobacteraceae bacterium]
MSVLDLQTVQCRIADGIGVMTLNRPPQLNAWIRRLGDDMLEALDGFASDPAVRAIVVTGAGRAFSSGADLKDTESFRPDGTVDVLTPLRESYNPVLMRIRTIDKPVIAAVNGPAAGIGCSLALACDLIVAARSAYFLLAFVNIGLGLDGGASMTLAARVGHARAFEIAYLGERIPASQALEWGMINRVVDDEQLQPAVDELAARLAAGAPGSYATIKRTINARAYEGFAELLDLEAVLQQQRTVTRDFREAAAAFAQKRAPSFTGE